MRRSTARYGEREEAVYIHDICGWPKDRSNDLPTEPTEGLAGIEEDSQIRVLYLTDRSGVPCVRRAVLLTESTPAGYLQRLMQQGKTESRIPE